MQCAILVGGMGTRLGPLTKAMPKPLLDVGGKPFLGHLIEEVTRFGFTDFVLLAGFMSEKVRQFAEAFTSARQTEITIRTIVEKDPLGTAGALRMAEDVLADEFILMNGDSWIDLNFLDLMNSKSDVKSSIVRMVLRHVEEASRFGVVALDPDCKVREMLERPLHPGPGLINSGVYLIRKRRFFDELESFENANVSLERDMLPMLVEKGRVTARTYDRFFIDIGVPDQYAAAQDQFPRRRGAVFFDRDGVLNHDGGYTHRVEDLRWIDGAKEAIKAVNDAGLFAFVVTNQAGVARGYYSEDDIKVFHDAMQRELRDFGAHIDAFEYCPHHPDGTVSNYQKTCERRKPGSGMLFDLMAEWPVEPAGSIMIGDRKSDLEAAEGAGIRGARFSGGSLSDLISDLNIGMPVSIPDASASLEEK